MKFFTAVLGFLAFVGAHAANPCKGLSKQDLIQSGIIELSNTITYKDTCYTVPIDYAIPRSGLKSIASCASMEGFNTREGIDYSIRVKRKGNSNAINLYLFAKDKVWKKVSVSYLVASREDLLLGSFIADTFRGFGCDAVSGEPYEIREAIADGPTNGKNYNAIAYISGMTALKDTVNVKLSNETFDTKTSILTIKIQSDSLVESIHVSYIIYRPDSCQFKIYGPAEIFQSDYNLPAVFGFSKSRHQSEQFAIIVDRRQCLGTGCLTTCINKKDCSNLSGLLNQNSCLICGKNERISQGKCVPICGPGFQLEKGICVCSPGFVPVGKSCLKQCPDNETYNQILKCDCRPGCIRTGGICRECPANSRIVGDKCICNSDYKWDDTKFICVKNPVLPTISCPPRSIWNPTLLTCECSVQDEHMINYRCQKCPTGQDWNGTACVCKSGLFRIGGICRGCDINTSYDGKNCVCNWGYFGTADKCQKCHISCGKCRGPDANHCLACAQVYLTLKDGYCFRQNNCPPGFYVDKTCKECPSYCSSCKSDSECLSCIPGFKLSSAKLDSGESVQFCSEICGDGRRFEDECDDGNTRNGDGCSSQCQVQKGFVCQGATTANPSTCSKKTINKSIITPTASAQFGGKVIQGIRLSYIPPQLTVNECESCYKLLSVRVISSAIVPSVQLRFIPKSQYQFYCEFDFYGIYSIPIFSISIQINPDFAKYFSSADMAQIQIKQIDPALLAKNDFVQTLVLDEDNSGGNRQIQEFIIKNG